VELKILLVKAKKKTLFFPTGLLKWAINMKARTLQK